MSLVSQARSWAQKVKRDLLVLWLAASDHCIPWHVKALAGCVAAYALSPIDLIPDFIPVLGYLDDLVIVPMGIITVVRLIPDNLLVDLRARATAIASRPKSVAGMAVILTIWAVCLLGLSAALLK